MAIDLCCCSCGGALDVTHAEGDTVTCEYCGKKQIIPSLDNESRLKAYKRATDFRLKKQFDEAQRIYESMLLQFPDDYEIHWGLCLCRYGVEYIEDFDGTRIPICHRNLYESILKDEDYIFALSHADGVSKEIIEKDAKYIDNVQKKYIEISKTERPYDVFISYKETDNFTKERTKDSLLAEDIYDALKKEGFNVFFSRISLEEKIGQDYEPNIEFALSTSKVMLLVGTSVDNINSTWVKSEWSRYMKFMQRDRGKKTLIPCYVGFDPYELPMEISSFQAQDMSKVGAVKDLVRGIKKLISPEENPSSLSSVIATLKKSGVSGESASNFLRRAEIQMSRGEIEEAKQSLNRCLNSDPENAKAYLLFAEIAYGVSSLEDIDDLPMKDPDVRTIYKDKVSKKSYESYDPNVKITGFDEWVVLDPFYANPPASQEYSPDEYKLIHDKRGFKNLLHMNEEEARKRFSYRSISELKDFKTAMRFADDKFKAEIEGHLARFNAKVDSFVKKWMDVYNKFIVKRFDELKDAYLSYAYRSSDLKYNKAFASCCSYLSLGDYRDSHARALEAAKAEITLNFLSGETLPFIKEHFEGEEQKELIELLNNIRETDKNATIKRIKEIGSLADKNHGIKYNYGVERDLSSRLGKEKNHARSLSSCFSDGSNPSGKAFISEMDNALRQASSSLDKAKIYGGILSDRRKKILRSTVNIDIIFLIIGLAMTIFAYATHEIVFEDVYPTNMYGLLFHRTYLYVGGVSTLFTIYRMILSSIKNKNKDKKKNVFDSLLSFVFVPAFAFGIGVAFDAIVLILVYVAPYCSYPLLINGPIRIVAVSTVIGLPTLITLIVELFRHHFKPVGASYIVKQVLLIIVAVAAIVTSLIFLDRYCSLNEIPSDFVTRFFDSF